MKIFLPGLIALLAAASAASSFAADFDPTVNFGDITALSADSITSEINSAMAIGAANQSPIGLKANERSNPLPSAYIEYMTTTSRALKSIGQYSHQDRTDLSFDKASINQPGL